MRKLNFLLLSALVFALAFTSCNKNDDDKTEPEKTQVENNTSGNTEVTPEKVTVTFDISGGTGTAEPQTVEKGTKITLPSGEGMEKDGYKFLGWSLTENGEIITEYTATESEVKLYAVWVKVFTVKFNTDGGTGEFASQTIEKGKTATKPETKPEKDNYVFMGWYDGDTKFDFSAAITADVDLKAKYAVLLKGVFSVSAEGKKVRFSGGNLQYHCKNKTWRFAPNQYDLIGDANQNISADYDGYIDLFGWGMWLEGQDPLQTDDDDSKYLSDIKTDGENFTGISAIGEEWITLTRDEWGYLLHEHTIKCITINGVICLVILPDNCTISIDSDWSVLEASGAIFLPLDGNFDFYWSATAYSTNKAYSPFFSKSGHVETGSYYGTSRRYVGLSVRLVRVLQN